MKKISEISKLNEQIRKLQDEFRYYQKLQEQTRYDYNHYNPASGVPYEIHVDACNEEISRNRIRLKYLQEKIIDLRKTVKEIQRKKSHEGNRRALRKTDKM